MSEIKRRKRYKKNKLIQGVGINDADYCVVRETMEGDRKIIWKCPFYARWANMLKRCYYKRFKDKNPSYKDCYVCDEWLTFSKFKSWMEQQDWEGKQLDKDILVVGNKEYGPEFCVFIDLKVNTFITENTANRGMWPIGVVLDKTREGRPYRSVCSSVVTGRQKDLGKYTTPEEAHEVWLAFKLEQSYILAAEQTDDRVARALISRYRNYSVYSEQDLKEAFEEGKKEAQDSEISICSECESEIY